MESSKRWDWYREHTPAARESVYLNAGWSGPMTDVVSGAMHAYLDAELMAGPTRRDHFDKRVAMREAYRENAAKVLGAPVDGVTITSNTTDGLNVVLSGLPLNEGDRVLSTTIEHPSGTVPLYWTRERAATEVEWLKLTAEDSNAAIVDRFASRIDRRTRLVLLSHISFATGQLLPLREIAEVAHRAGAQVLVDGAQTAGHLPLDMEAMGADFYAIPMHKWMCGPSGLGALYIRPELIPMVQPQRTSGRGAESWDYEGGFVPAHADIKKFETGTLSTVSVAGANAAIEQYLESGPEAVFNRVIELTRHAETRFAKIPGFELTSPAREEARTGLFAFRLDGIDALLAAPQLQRNHRIVCRSVRTENAIRLSLHVYNNEADIEAAAAAVEALLRDGLEESPDAGPAD